jgi:putative transposase
MKGKRHSPEQIVRKLREADRLLAEGADVDAVCRHLEVSVQTYQRVGIGRVKEMNRDHFREDMRELTGQERFDLDDHHIEKTDVIEVLWRAMGDRGARVDHSSPGRS